MLATVAICCLATLSAQATITIRVRADVAPHIHAWTSSGGITAFPGAEMTEAAYDGVNYWTWSTEESSVSFLLNNGSGGTNNQTADHNNVTADVFYYYNGYNISYPIGIPDAAAYEPSGYYIYFVNDLGWSTVNCHVYNSSSNNTAAMTQVGTDANGHPVYQWKASSLSFTPANVIFNNGKWASAGGVETGSFTFENGAVFMGGYYNNDNSMRADRIATLTEDRVKNSDTYFADAHLREAITKCLNVAEGAYFKPSQTTALDLTYDTDAMTGKITNVNSPTGRGIAMFSNATKLLLPDNDLQYLDLRDNHAIETLNISNNNTLLGVRNSANIMARNGDNGGGIAFATDAALKHFDASECDDFKYMAGMTTWGQSSVEWLSLKNCPQMDGWSTGIAAQTGLKYLDLTNTGQNVNHSASDSRINLSALVHLDTLILADNTSLGAVALTNNSRLTYLDLTNCGLTETTAKTILDKVALAGLETLIIAENTGMKYAYTTRLQGLKHLDLSDGNLYFNASYQLESLTPANNPLLETLDISNSKLENPQPISGFQKLKTVKAQDNYYTSTGNGIHALTIENCPAIETVDITNNQVQTILSINDCGLTALPDILADNTPLLTQLSLNGNRFTAVPTTGISTIATLYMNSNQLTDINVPESNIQYLYARGNNFPAAYTLPQTTLAGLDLGDNGFTSFNAENNTSLKALCLDANSNLTTINLHGNTLLTQTAPNNVIQNDNGLYIKGLSSLKTLNIENSNFNKIGQESSLEGCTGITHLYAKNNKFTTFSNAYNTYTSPRPKDSTRPSLEHLTGLTYIDLSHNQLCDSLHLFKNTQLDTLILAHNRTITEFADQAAYQAGSTVQKRFFTHDDIGMYNDTTGLRMLNLQHNPNVKYVDVSYTAIQYTAENETYMDNFATKANETSDHREGHFVYIKPTSASLEEFYGDYNGMKTFGYVGNVFSKLKRISQIETRGQDETIMQGSLNPNRGGTIPNLEYLDISYSDLDTIGVVYLTKLKYLNVTGNWTKDNWTHWGGQAGEGRTLNLTRCADLVECRADSMPYCEVILASGVSNLSSMSLDQDPGNTHLKKVYVDHTALPKIDNVAYVLPVFPKRTSCSVEMTRETPDLGLSRLNTAANLELLWCNSNSSLATIDVTGNTALKYLHAYDNAFGQDHSGDGIDLANNTALLACWISNDGLTTLNVDNCTSLDTLKCYDNPHLAALAVDKNTVLRYLDLARDHVGTLDVSKNTILNYFDCRNSDAWNAETGNWISDLNFASPNLTEVHADYNDLHCMTFPATTTLTRIEYPHNHINGIDLSGASATLTAAGIIDNDNGRTITAECSKTYANVGGEVTPIALYYFQTDNTVVGGGDFLPTKTSTDSKQNTRRLADDQFSLDGLIAWNGTNSALFNPTSGAPRRVTVTPDNMNAYLDPENIVGTIVVLNPTTEDGDGASGQATYTYNNGIGQSEFYLNWSSNGIVTAITDVNTDRGTLAPNAIAGGINVAGADGTEVNVYDLAGRRVAGGVIEGGSFTVTDLTPGIYIVGGTKVIVR